MPHQPFPTPARDAALDPLTGLLGREAVLEHLAALLSAGRTDFAVLFCDLDGFKTVNDTLGHAAGDEVLRQVAARLREHVGDDDVPARIGGDEFLIVIRTVEGAPWTATPAHSLVAALTGDYEVGDADCRIGASIGIALPDGRKGPQRLVWDADIAMYTAKRDRCGVALFTDALEASNRQRRQLEVDLGKAVDSDALHMVYQPLYAAATGTVESVEALARWTHPVHGSVSPEVFIPIAERLGLIDRIGMFALTRALEDLSRWRANGPAPARVSVNVAPSQLDASFVAEVATALAQAGVEPSALTVEITESALPSDDAPVVLADLADLGVSVDVDDFGTGYSSLVNLVRLPVHAVKVDRSLTWGLDSDPRLQTAVRAIIHLAHDLDMRCVVEGVETDAQQQWLAREGCDLLQGFHLSKPVPADAVPALCAAALP